MFTQSCFIRNARKELAFDVAALGYVPMFMVFRNNIEGNHLVLEGDTWHFTDSDNHPNCIDCGTNENLFLAIAALRDDSDYMQWFTNGKEFIQCDRQDWIDMYSTLCCGSKYSQDELDSFDLATVGELIEHFGKEKL